MALEEILGKVGDQLGNLLGLPAVLALIVINGELRAPEEAANALGVAADLSHYSISRLFKWSST